MQSPLVVHVIRRLAVGGMENGLVNLINHMRHDRYRHAIICLSDSTDFSQRLQRGDVRVIELHQRKGREVRVHGRFFRLLRALRPDIVHTRNLPALEFQMTAAMAGVRGRIHGEHGRDLYDLDGTNFKYNALRKLMRLFIHRYIGVSRNLSDWLVDTVSVPPERVTQIYNGVDVDKFRPRGNESGRLGPEGFLTSDCFVVGTVGRMELVKDPITLVRAFIRLVQASYEARKRLRLVMIGDGSLRPLTMELLRSAQMEDLTWLPGERNDVPELMRSMDLFVLPSLREGISNTILEAMATGLPVVATRVGGNPELITENVTGMMVPPSDPIAVAEAVQSYFRNLEMRIGHGCESRRKVESSFTMDAMVAGYLNVYDSILLRRDASRQTIPQTADSDVH